MNLGSMLTDICDVNAGKNNCSERLLYINYINITIHIMCYIIYGILYNKIFLKLLYKRAGLKISISRF